MKYNGAPMITRNSYEETSKEQPGENTQKFQRLITKLRGSGLEVIDTTVGGNAVGLVGGVRKPAKKVMNAAISGSPDHALAREFLQNAVHGDATPNLDLSDPARHP
jgi:hypothetical protein